MSEMGDRVARAMKLRASQPVGNLPSLEGVLVGSLGDAWPYLAEAAMAEMREPTVAMYKASRFPNAGCIGDQWRAMLDAALGKRE